MVGGRSRLLGLFVAALVVALAACDVAPSVKDADNGGVFDHGWFEGGKVWRGDLNDPHVIKVGGTYVAYGSPMGGRYLPVLTSTDLITWYAHPRWSTSGPPGTPGYDVNADQAVPGEVRFTPDSEWGKYDNNDALVQPASWGVDDQQGAWLRRDLWAPGVFQIAGTWYVYSAVRVSWESDDPHGGGRFCLTVASGPSALGPFRDISGSGPIQCQSVDHDPAGSIDPYPYRDPSTGRNYLLWKAAGKIGVRESASMSVELGWDGKPLAGATPVRLLQTNRKASWEGSTIENPAMIRYRGTYYLFYSANDAVVRNDQGDSRYATGYAICDGPLGPCTRPEPGRPLLSNTSTQKGRGGASAFFDAAGGLHLAYAYDAAGEVRSEFQPRWLRHPRRLAITTVTRSTDGKLRAG